MSAADYADEIEQRINGLTELEGPLASRTKRLAAAERQVLMAADEAEDTTDLLNLADEIARERRRGRS